MGHSATDLNETRILLYYCFTPIEDPTAVMLWQRTLCEQLGLTGRILISKHGILIVEFANQLREQGMDPSQAESAAQLAGAFGLVGGIIVTVIMIGVYLLVYFPLKAGKNWGRILGTIFAVLAILSGIYGLFSGQEGLSTGIFIAGIVLSVIKLIVDILWIVTAYKAPTSAWFNQNRVQR